MHLCFVDESGTAPKPGASYPPYFVIAGVVMHEAQWQGVAADLSRLRTKPEFLVSGEIKWRFFGKDNSDPRNSVKHLSADRRHEFRQQFFNILVRRKSIKVIACVTNVDVAYATSYVKNAEDLYYYTYKAVSERFQYFLQDMTRTVGAKQLGIIISDHRGTKQDDLMRSRHHELVDRDGWFSSEYDNYVETIFMTPSHRSVGIQFADMVAGAIGRALVSGDRTYYEMLSTVYRASPIGKIDGYGLVRFPNGWDWPPGGGLSPPRRSSTRPRQDED